MCSFKVLFTVWFRLSTALHHPYMVMMTLRERLHFCCLEVWPKIQVRMEDYVTMK